jgi:hypothetical protein
MMKYLVKLEFNLRKYNLKIKKMEKDFYKNLKLFLKDLLVIFPEDDESIQMITTAINLAIMDDDDSKIIKDFYKAMFPLEHYIIKQDDAIFETDPADFWSISSYEYKLFLKIHTEWDTFTLHNKSMLWQYIQYLYILSKNIVNVI